MYFCVCVCVVAVLLSHVFLSYVVYFIHVYHINYHQGFRNAMLLNLLARFIFSIIQTVHFDKINGNSINIDYLNV